jgi:hypothetical protein
MDATLFEQLNKPFAYKDYEYNSNDERVYVNGQVVAERLNEVLGVGYWSYKPVEGTIEVIDTGKTDKNKEPIRMLSLLVEFRFYNKEIQQWVIFEDAGSQKMNARMLAPDATKSAITDGLKKCASRIGVASDLYAGRITTDSSGTVILPWTYREYYDNKGWTDGKFEPAPRKKIVLNDAYALEIKDLKSRLGITNDGLNEYVRAVSKDKTVTYTDINDQNAPLVIAEMKKALKE